jgi:hypothetical protein
MIDITTPMGDFAYRRLIPRTDADLKRIAEIAAEITAEIDEAKISTITDYQKYRVTKSLTHESESDQLHICWRTRRD